MKHLILATLVFAAYVACGMIMHVLHDMGTDPTMLVSADYTRREVFWTGVFCAVFAGAATGLLILAIYFLDKWHDGRKKLTQDNWAID